MSGYRERKGAAVGRVIVSSGALLRQVSKVEDFRRITIQVCGTHLALHSTYRYGDELPCETRARFFESSVNAGRLRKILQGIADQPITLDLHRNFPERAPAGKLFACRVTGHDPMTGKDLYENLEFDLCNEYSLDCR